MLIRVALLLLIGCSIAALGVIGFVTLRPAPQVAQEAAAPKTVRLLVATEPVRAGNLLLPEDITAQEVAQADAPAGAHVDSGEARAKLRGAMVRRSLDKGQPILDADVLHPGDHGFLAAVLAPGTRAVSVAVDAVSGTAGLIWPGDRVDLILTQSIDSQDRAPGQRVAGETVLSDVRVIAVDQQIMQGAQPSGGAQSLARTVTLEVTPSQAERVAVSTRLGHLALVVRSADEASTKPQIAGTPAGATQAAAITAAAPARAPASGVVWGGDVSAALRSGGGGPGAAVRVYQGKDQAVEFKF